ncbi:aquaporin-11-like [Aplochiton taeniatus]
MIHFDLGLSLALLAAIVLISETIRWTITRFLPQKGFRIYLLETVSTFQLCACTHELKLLGEVGQIERQIGLTLTYIVTVIHIITFREALCNPIGAFENVYRRNITAKSATGFIICQFIAAIVAQYLGPYIWSLGLSNVHVTHEKFGYKCFDPINGSLVEAAAVELACAFTIQASIMHIHNVHRNIRSHVIAGVVTFLVYAGGSVTGAVFNPVLAFSIQFPCSGHSFMEYCFVYWLGPVLGVSSSILLFEKILPFLSVKKAVELDVPVTQKKIQ